MDDMYAKLTISDALATPENFQAVWGENAHKLMTVVNSCFKFNNSVDSHPGNVPLLANMIPGFRINEAWVDYIIGVVEAVLSKYETPAGFNTILSRSNRGRWYFYTMSQYPRYTGPYELNADDAGIWSDADYADDLHAGTYCDAVYVMNQSANSDTHYIHAMFTLLATYGYGEGDAYARDTLKSLVKKVYPTERGNNLNDMLRAKVESLEESKARDAKFLTNFPVNESGIIKTMKYYEHQSDAAIYAVTPEQVFSSALTLSFSISGRFDISARMANSLDYYGYLLMLAHEPGLWGLDSDSLKRVIQSNPQYLPYEYLRTHPDMRPALKAKHLGGEVSSMSEFECCSEIHDRQTMRAFGTA